jgi:hypothetical protein
MGFDSMIDWLSRLLDTDGFLARGHCGPWSEGLKATYIVANATIALAYFLIPVALWILWQARRRDLVYPWILLCFVGFITFCGLTHVCDVVVFWWPAYRLFTLMSIATAVLSLATACLLPIEVRYLLGVPTPEQWRKAQEELEAAGRAKDAAIRVRDLTVAGLQQQVRHLERMQEMGMWASGQERVLKDLKTLLDSPAVKEVIA